MANIFEIEVKYKARYKYHTWDAFVTLNLTLCKRTINFDHWYSVFKGNIDICLKFNTANHASFKQVLPCVLQYKPGQYKTLSGPHWT